MIPLPNDIGCMIPYGDGWARITKLFDERGDITTDVFEATAVVVRVLEGEMAGCWISFGVDDPDEFFQEMFQVC